MHRVLPVVPDLSARWPVESSGALGVRTFQGGGQLASEFYRILLNQLVFLFAGRVFPGYSSSPGGFSSEIFDNSFVYLFPA
jgi:hypothetical protein